MVKNYNGDFCICVWTSGGGFTVEQTPEIKAEVKKVLKLWKESRNLEGYCPGAREDKVLEYNKTPGYEVSTVSEQTGVEAIDLYKIVNTEKLWSNKKGYIVTPTPQTEIEVKKILKILEDIDLDNDSILKIQSKLFVNDSLEYGIAYFDNRENKTTSSVEICLYKILN